MPEHDIHIIETGSNPTGSIIWMHGLGADNRNFDTLIPEILPSRDKSLRFIFPNAPIIPVTINHNFPTRAWYDVYSLEHLDHEDESGIENSQAFIENLIDLEIKNGIPSERIVIAGFSQGGAMALHTGIRSKQKLAGILALSCYLPLFHQLSSKMDEINKYIPIFIAHGHYDNVLPMSSAKITHTALDNTHPNAKWHEYEMGHEICAQEIFDIKNWMQMVFR